MRMASCGLRVASGLLLVIIASSTRAEGNLDEGKSAAQLYASACASCHKSPRSVSKTRVFGLESFLREHYTSNRESAAILAAYLEGQRRPSADVQRGREARHMGQAKGSNPIVNEFGEEIPRPPVDIPDVK